jgi:hypothetical protein
MAGTAHHSGILINSAWHHVEPRSFGCFDTRWCVGGDPAAAGAAAGLGNAHPTNGLGGMCGEPAISILEPAHVD